MSGADRLASTPERGPLCRDANDYQARPAPADGQLPSPSPPGRVVPNAQTGPHPSLESSPAAVNALSAVQHHVPAPASEASQLPGHHSPTGSAPLPSSEETEGYTQEDIDRMIAGEGKKRVVVVHGVVYDVTAFAPHHPGGSGVFVSGNGKDVSVTFDAMHGPRAKAKLKNWAIGPFLKERPKARKAVPAPGTAPSPSLATNESSKGGHSGAEAPLAERELSMADIHDHLRRNPRLLLLILFGDVYDISNFAREHPGGTRVLESNKGKECGETFMRIHGLRARAMVKQYYIGHVKDAPPCVSPLRSAPKAETSPQMSLTRMRANSTRLLETEPLPTSYDIRYLTFACPFKMHVPPGGHIKIYSNVDQGEGRYYTPFKTELASFTVCVKHYPHSRTSGYLFNLRPGDEVFYDGPFDPAWGPHTDASLNDNRVPNTEKHVLLLAGGTGVSPLYTIAQDLLTRQAANATLLLAVQSHEQLLLSGELAALEAKHQRKGQCCFSVFVAFSRSFSSASAAQERDSNGATTSAAAGGDGGLVLTRENTLFGKVNAKMLRRLPLPRTTQAVVVCGPPTFNEDMVRATVDAAVCKEKDVHVLN